MPKLTFRLRSGNDLTGDALSMLLQQPGSSRLRRRPEIIAPTKPSRLRAEKMYGRWTSRTLAHAKVQSISLPASTTLSLRLGCRVPDPMKSSHQGHQSRCIDFATPACSSPVRSGEHSRRRDERRKRLILYCYHRSDATWSQVFDSLAGKQHILNFPSPNS